MAKALPPRVSTDKVAEQFDVVQQIDARPPRSADIRGLRRSWWLAPHPSWLALATSARKLLHICTSAALQIYTSAACTSEEQDLKSAHYWQARKNGTPPSLMVLLPPAKYYFSRLALESN